MADQINERLTGVENSLKEGSAEILAELGKLRGEVVSEEGLATLARLEEMAKGIADISPSVEPPAEPV